MQARPSKSEDDIRVRAQLRAKESKAMIKIDEDVKREQDAMRLHFEELNKRKVANPRLLRRKRFQQKSKDFGQILSSLNLRKSITHFQPLTPEENQTVARIFRHFKSNCLITVPVNAIAAYSLFYTSNMKVSLWNSALILCAGTIGGCLLSGILTMRTAFRLLQGLGKDYRLGQSVIQQIQENRMDKVKLQQ